MIDLIQQLQVIQAVEPTSGAGAAAGDYILMKNCHAIWCVASFRRDNSNTCAITHEVASDFAGTGSSAVSTGVQSWSAPDTTANGGQRLVARTTLAYAYTLPAAAKPAVYVSRFDPSCVPTNSGTSNTHYCVKFGTMASSKNNMSATYYIEPRYPGYQHLLATTSST